jgi:hypothetical protein
MYRFLASHRRSLDKDLIDEYGQVCYGYPKYSPDGDYLEVPLTTYSNYSGGTAEHANCNYFLDRFGALAGVHEMYGGHGTRGVLIEYKLYENNEEIRDVIDSLNDYPVMSDNFLSDLEDQLELEAWNNWVKDDLIAELEKRGIKYPEDEVDLQTHFYRIVNGSDTYFVFKDAVSADIDIKKVVDSWELFKDVE